MQMLFVKMIQFTSLVKAEGRLREFNFRKIKGPDEELFSVNVCTERGDRIIFNMQKKDNTWKIVPGQVQVPQWVVQTENKLSEVIEEEIRNPS